MPLVLIALVVLLALLVATIWRSLRRTSVAPTDAFADLYDVELTDRSRSVLADSLERSRRLRFAGAAVVAVLYVAFDRGAGPWSLLAAVAVGFAVGSLVDESTRPRTAQAVKPTATLDRRSVFTFVERWVVAVLGLTVFAMIAGCVVLLRLDEVGVPDTGSPTVPSRNVSIAIIAAVITATTLGAVLLRRLALLPTGADTPDLLAIRHALRMASVLSVVGAMLVIFGFVGLRLAEIAMLNDGSRRSLLQWTSNSVLIVSFLAVVTGLPLSLRALPRTVSRRHRRSTSPSRSTASSSSDAT